MYNQKMSLSKMNEKNPVWKGDKVGYFGLHKWIERKSGKPKYCEHCQCTNKRRYEWANISGEYKRDVKDFIRLCKGCHKKYDYTEEWKKNVSMGLKKYWQNHSHPLMGKQLSEEHKNKISSNLKKYYQENLSPMFGKKHTKEARQKMAIGHNGRKFSEEHKNKISLKLKGNKNPLGQKRTEETKKKMSIAQKNRYAHIGECQ